MKLDAMLDAMDDRTRTGAGVLLVGAGVLLEGVAVLHAGAGAPTAEAEGGAHRGDDDRGQGDAVAIAAPAAAPAAATAAGPSPGARNELGALQGCCSTANTDHEGSSMLKSD